MLAASPYGIAGQRQAAMKAGTYNPQTFGMTASQQMAAKEQEAKAANLAREKEIRGIYSQIISRYEPGGAFERSQLGQLEQQKTQALGQGTQHLISSGLYNTTMQTGMGNAWERDVGGPSRLRLEDVMTTRRNEAQMNLAGFIERISNEYPDQSPLMNAAAAQGFADRYGGSAGGGSGSLFDQTFGKGNLDPNALAIQAPMSSGSSGPAYGSGESSAEYWKRVRGESARGEESLSGGEEPGVGSSGGGSAASQTPSSSTSTNKPPPKRLKIAGSTDYYIGYTRYDAAGNVVAKIDPNAKPTTRKASPSTPTSRYVTGSRRMSY